MIVAFISPKGGAGRTTALANSALEIARLGHRVLAVDFDLDAPSLHCFFGLGDDATLAEKHLGVVDLTQAFIDAASGATESFPGLDREHLLAPVWKDVKTVRNATIKGVRQKVLKVHPDAELHLLGAGRLDEGYRDRAASLHWGELYDQPAFRDYVAWLRARFEALADVTFVDARAGATDIGSLCAFALADLVVLCCPPTYQALATTFAFARRAATTRSDGAKGRCLFIASRVQRGADDRHLASWRAEAVRGARQLADLWVVGRGRDEPEAEARAMVERFEVPEVPVHAVGEPLIRLRMLEREEETDPLLEAWAPLLNEIRRLLPMKEPDHTASVKAAEEALAKAVRAGKLDQLPDLYASLAAAVWREGEARGWTPERTTQLEELAARGIGVAEVTAENVVRGLLFLFLARARWRAGRPEVAFGAFERAAELFRDLGHHVVASEILDEMGLCAKSTGDHSRASALFEEAIAELRREPSPNHFAIGSSLHSLARRHRDAGDLAKARSFFAQAVAEFELNPKAAGRAAAAKKALASLGNDPE